MNNDKIRITVDSEPVSAEVNWDDVRAYLRAKGWTEGTETTINGLGEDLGGSVNMWTKDGGHALVWSTGVEFQSRYRIRIAVQSVARHEKRHPAAVLRDIAAGDPLHKLTVGSLWRQSAPSYDPDRAAAYFAPTALITSTVVRGWWFCGDDAPRLVELCGDIFERDAAPVR